MLETPPSEGGAGTQQMRKERVLEREERWNAERLQKRGQEFESARKTEGRLSMSMDVLSQVC